MKKILTRDGNPRGTLKCLRSSKRLYNPSQETFKDASGVYYATTKLPHLEYVRQQDLIVEQAGRDTRLKDVNGNEYRIMEWHEVCDLTWKGNPFFHDHATSTAPSREEGFSGQTEKSNANATFSAWTTGRQPNPPWSTVNEPDRQRG